MKVVYNNQTEFAQALLRCARTAENIMCQWCPLFDDCDPISMETRVSANGDVELPEAQRCLKSDPCT